MTDNRSGERVPIERRVLAVLAADVVSFSRRMERDEDRTYDALVACRGLMASAVSENRGRIASSPGDFILASFDDAGDAVGAARRFVTALRHRNAALSERDRLAFRLGIGFGEVIETSSDLLGTPVNIAARVQQMAQPDQILVAGAVYDALQDRPGIAFRPLGIVRLKNFEEQVRVYAVVDERMDGDDPARGAREGAAGAASADARNRVSIQIVSFRALSEGADATLFAEGMTQELVAILGTLSGAVVMIEGSEREPPQEAFALSGTVRLGSRLRVTAKLVRLQSAETIWADRFDYDPDDTFDAQEEIARNVVAALQVRLTEGEQARLWHSGTRSVRAWECFQRGHDLERRSRRECHEQAIELYAQALRHDPHYIAPLVAMGFCYVDQVRFGWSDDDAALLARAAECEGRATALDPNFPDLHALRGFILALQGRPGEALDAAHVAVGLAPQNSEMAGYLGALYRMLGRHAEAIEWYQRAMELSPLYSVWLATNMANALTLLGRNIEAARIYETALRHDANFVNAYAGLTIVRMRLGDRDGAVEAARKVMQIDPLFRINRWARRHAMLDAATQEALKRDLLAAGLQ